MSDFAFFNVSWSSDNLTNHNNIVRRTVVHESINSCEISNLMILTFFRLHTTSDQFVLKWRTSFFVYMSLIIRITCLFVSKFLFFMRIYYFCVCLCISNKMIVQFSAISSFNEKLFWIMFWFRSVANNWSMFWFTWRK